MGYLPFIYLMETTSPFLTGYDSWLTYSCTLRLSLYLTTIMWWLQIANALYYNPALTLETLNKLGVAADIFNHWFVMLQQVKKSGARVNFKRYGSRFCTVIFLHVPTMSQYCCIASFAESMIRKFAAWAWLLLLGFQLIRFHQKL